MKERFTFGFYWWKSPCLFRAFVHIHILWIYSLWKFPKSKLVEHDFVVLFFSHFTSLVSVKPLKSVINKSIVFIYLSSGINMWYQFRFSFVFMSLQNSIKVTLHWIYIAIFTSVCEDTIQVKYSTGKTTSWDLC